MNDCCQHALKYLKAGCSVIPCGKDKRPLISWLPYQEKRATEDEISEWWAKTPDANIAIITGKVSGITVVDCDSNDAAGKFRSIYKGETPTVKTPRGTHYYFKYAEGVRNTVKVAGLDLDVRGDGGYVIAPPSINGEGVGYRWLKEIGSFALDSFDFNSFNARAREGDVRNLSDLTKPDKPLHFLTLGTRDNDLFHVGNCLIKGGCEPDKALQVLEILANSCNPPFPEKEVQTKIKSVLARCERRERNLTEDLRKWIDLTSAYFSLTETYDPLQILTSQKNTVHQIMHRFVKDEYVERHPNKNGVYRRVDQTIEYMDFENADPNDTIDLHLPLDMHKKTKLFPKAVIALAGLSGMGKTLFALNAIRENMDRMPCFYFNSEISPQQLKLKLSCFPTPMTEWVKHMKVVDGWDFNSIADKIQADALNVVDYLEPEGERPYLIHGVISAIIRKLNKGIAFITIQKKPGAKLGTGGVYSVKAASLALALDYGRIEIVKNRNREADPHPSFNAINFDVKGGFQIVAKGGWYAANED